MMVRSHRSAITTEMKQGRWTVPFEADSQMPSGTRMHSKSCGSTGSTHPHIRHSPIHTSATRFRFRLMAASSSADRYLLTQNPFTGGMLDA
jgi:hypothetical protein